MKSIQQGDSDSAAWVVAVVGALLALHDQWAHYDRDHDQGPHDGVLQIVHDLGLDCPFQTVVEA